MPKNKLIVRHIDDPWDDDPSEYRQCALRIMQLVNALSIGKASHDAESRRSADRWVRIDRSPAAMPRRFGDCRRRRFLMRLEYFGDSYDIVKRALLEWFYTARAVAYTQPLFTEDASLSQATAFARFLGARLVQPVHGSHRGGVARQPSTAARGLGNLLVDPDIGVVLPQPGKSVKRTHLSVAALQVLCAANPGNVIMSFDQALRREAPEESLRSKVVWLAEGGTAALAFRSHASFIFCSSSSGRVDDVARLLLEAGLPESRLVRA